MLGRGSTKRRASGTSESDQSQQLLRTVHRDDSSLNSLTKKFIDLMSETKDGVLDLNSAAEQLNVSCGCWSSWLLLSGWLLSESSCAGAKAKDI